MNKKKILTFIMILTIIFTTLPTGSIAANANNNGNGGLNYRDKITPADIKKAGAAFAQAYGTTALAASSLVADPNTGELIPDYFGTANWAYSPLLTKFIDKLPGLRPEGANALGQYIPVAVPDTTSYPGSDYYEIAVVQYTERLHTELPATTLRGYVQLSTSNIPGQQVQLTYPDGTPITKGDGTPALAVDKPHYLGPAILSESNRPVRIKFYNLLPTGVAGDLFIPTDTTVMGAGDGTMVMNGQSMTDAYTQNRSNIHLHGNNTVWISDGTPHQWITPANDKDALGNPIMYPQGVSVVDVPDMAPATVSSKTDGTTTLYYTNAQSARLMFYHDHSYGITRLNVYAGEAAPYIIQDQVEKDLIDGTNVSGVNPLNQKLLPDAGIPLVIQDKTFVDDTTVLQTDPTWHWGTSPAPGQPYVPTPGDLWYPHVYMPAQNPWAPDGVNPFGRWMYGPWFYPPTTNIMQGPIDNPYYDPANPDKEPPLMPGTPSPSMPGEAFMDTPLVNGTAYPYMEVDPHAYRFRILNASDDRFFNLQMYVADDTQNLTNGYPTEVKMVPADPAIASIPSHLEQIMPDQTPTMVGPDWIQIGTEGGFLPAPAVIPAQSISWNLNLTTFNAGNVDKHSLLLGSAERADVIVDFSQYAGKTLILYNDAPAPFPADDSRYDYYTGDPDQTSTGGAPSTLPGKGPNTRTIMQIRVSANGTPTPYDLGALQAVFAKGAITTATGSNPGVFAADQEPIIVPQSEYNSAYGVTNLPSDPAKAYIQIDEDQKTFQTIDAAGNLQSEVTLPLEPKAMHDEMGGVYDPYGRMSGMLGLTDPTANSTNATFIAYGYASPPVDIVKGTEDITTTQIGSLADGTQIWKITHNGVDTHTIHTHLFDAQLVNRVAWDGILMPPDANELGWKETFRVNPLEITYLALRPKVPTAAQVPFEVPNSVRLIDPTMPEGAVLMAPPLGWFDPLGNPITQILNHKVNFGWEYVWHCHILSHEEMDMMHTLSFAVAPKAPVNLAVKQSGNGNKKANVLTWTDKSSNETSFVVQRSAASTGPWTTLATLPANTTTYSDTIGNTNTAYYYKVFAANTVGDTTLANFPVVTQNSADSNVMVVGSQTTLKPAPPTNLTAALQTGPQVLLNWTDNAVNETGFVIQRSTNGGAFANLITVGPKNATGTVSYVDTTVMAGNSYRYQVAAVNSAGNSAWSNIATATLPTVPAAPTNVLAAASTSGNRWAQVTVTWKDNANNETAYVIDRATDPAFTANLVTAQVGANKTTYTTGNLTRNTPYYFRVRAINGVGQSASVNAAPSPVYTP